VYKALSLLAFSLSPDSSGWGFYLSLAFKGKLLQSKQTHFLQISRVVTALSNKYLINQSRMFPCRYPFFLF
jgi:hypothetical protein